MILEDVFEGRMFLKGRSIIGLHFFKKELY